MSLLRKTKLWYFWIFTFLIVSNFSCKKNNSVPSNPLQTSNYQQVNLVADLASLNPAFVDTNLVNPWGMAISPTGIFWISDNHTGLTTIYNNTGKTILSPVAIPLHGVHRGNSPTGAIFNSTPDFVEPANGKKAFFIYASEDGVISAWNGGDSTVAVADFSATGSVYKGIALANDGTANFLYLTDFKNGKIDVVDKSFRRVSDKPFADPTIPAGFSPFNIKCIANNLYVTYAKQKVPDNHDDQAGPGNGYVNLFTTKGELMKRFASGASLNSPWGLAQTTAGFGLPQNSILVGNFGDGKINVFDSLGVYKGQLMSGGQPLIIDGLWETSFENATGIDPNLLYFTAAPSQESHGVFGYLKQK